MSRASGNSWSAAATPAGAATRPARRLLAAEIAQDILSDLLSI